MAKLPVWRGSPLKPLWINSGSGLAPAFAEDPCSCCGDSGGGPPGGPFASCFDCLSHVHGITLQASGYQSRVCEYDIHFPHTGLAGPIIQHCTVNCSAGALNGMYSLTTETSRGRNFVCFKMTMGTPRTCTGRLVAHSECHLIPPFDHREFSETAPGDTYLQAVYVCVVCDDSGNLRFSSSCDLQGCSDGTPGGEAIGTIGLASPVAVAPWADVCGGGAAIASAVINNCTDSITGPDVSVCEYLNYTVTHRFRLE